MLKYINRILSEALSDMVGEAAIPVANQLFEVQYDAEEFTPEEQNLYGTFVAKLIFLCCRSGPDILPAVAYTITRIKIPDLYDYNNLSRMIRYVCTTKDLLLMLVAENSNIIKWWVYSSF